MATQPTSEPILALCEADQPLLDELPTFELFFKTFGFKHVHGRVWGLLVLATRPLSSKEISAQLSLSQAAVSTTISELSDWGAIQSSFDSAHRCHVHSPVGNALSIVATVFRRREQVVFQQFRQAAMRSLSFIKERHGERDPRVLTLQSIVSTCDIADALMRLVLSAVQNAMSDSSSVLSRAINAAFKVGVGAPARWLFGAGMDQARAEEEAELLDEEAGPVSERSPSLDQVELTPQALSRAEESTSGADERALEDQAHG